jgi:hypothetical protein
MIRFLLLMCLAAGANAAESPVDIDTAARVYLDSAMRDQVRASLGSMPEHIRQLFATDTSAKLTDAQLAAVTAAAVRGFRIDVFEVPALQALANNLDLPTVNKIESFLNSDLGRRMVADDVALAELGEANIDKVMGGETAAPSTPQRDAIFERLERVTHSAESTVQIFLSMGQAVAVGTAVGSGLDPVVVGDRAHKSGEASRAGLEENMRLPMRRFMAYGYRDLSEADLKRMLAFMESPAGKRYVAAYNASMGAGFNAMGRRTGEQLGETLREMAQSEQAPPPEVVVPPGIAPASPEGTAPAAPPPTPQR